MQDKGLQEDELLHEAVRKGWQEEEAAVPEDLLRRRLLSPSESTFGGNRWPNRPVSTPVNSDPDQRGWG